MPIAKPDLIIELFPQCNLNCDFCMQTEVETYEPSREQVIHFPKEYYIKKCLESIRKNNLKHDTIAMWGGELFYDNSNEYTISMIKFLEELKPKHCSMHTNLIFNTNTNQLYHYFMNHFSDWTIEISYDPVGRYKSEKMKMLFEKNVEKVLKLALSKDKNKSLPIYTILQPEVLLQECDLSFMDKVDKADHLDLVLLFDYRVGAYTDKIFEKFNEYYFNILKRFPNCQNVKLLKGYKRVYPNNLCRCLQKTTTFLTYNTNFNLLKDNGCIYYSGACNSISHLRKAYHCDECKYQTKCVDVCSSIIETLGFFDKNRSCYQKYAYDHLHEIE